MSFSTLGTQVDGTSAAEQRERVAVISNVLDPNVSHDSECSLPTWPAVRALDAVNSAPPLTQHSWRRVPNALALPDLMALPCYDAVFDASRAEVGRRLEVHNTTRRNM